MAVGAASTMIERPPIARREAAGVQRKGLAGRRSGRASCVGLCLSEGECNDSMPFRIAKFLGLLMLAPAVMAQGLAERLQQAAPAASAEVLRLAADAVSCANDRQAKRLAVIDYSLPSTEPRLWVFDLRKMRLMYEELVAHGRNTGELLAERFSNQPGSYASSLGLFRTLNTYVGRNGYSLRMEGLEPGVNDKAYERAIVIHGADYVSESFIEQTGRLGRSLGCPALRQDVAREVIDSLSDGQFVFSYYPDNRWLNTSRFVNCDKPRRTRLHSAP
jgi:hypothetical protein